ncbi:UPF0164 family protein [Flavobacterium sp.]|uniref:UPF0164 family protein n=1 Tax=Flavobacterium sp. TaxID=239 RepID=UPI0038D4714B
MKKVLVLIFISFSFNVAQSQEIKDAVQYSQDNLNGTARFRAMGGAFGALGGDLSSLNVNPAGSAIFSNNQLGMSLSSFNTRNNSDYFGTSTSESHNNFDMNQLGVVFVFKNQNQSSSWKKFSMAINYDNTNNFDNSVFSRGVNPFNSIDDYFLNYARQNGGVPTQYIDSFYYSHSLDNQGNPILGSDGLPIENYNLLANYFGTSQQNIANNLNSYIYQYIGEVDGKDAFANQQAFLGYGAYVIDPLVRNDPNNKNYISLVPAGGNYYQENSIVSKGYNGKLSFNAATSFENKLNIGVNLNSHFTDYIKSTSFYESNKNPLESNYSVTNLRFDNNLHTYGGGFSFQIGIIAKITNEVRLGFAFDSPIWYVLNDELSQKLVVVSSKTGANDVTDSVDPNFITIFAPYKLQTPSKITGSFAYIFGKKGLISIDYALKNYNNTQFHPKNDLYYRDLNNYMSSVLNTTGEFRLGAEYKIKEWSLRGGYRFEESPYKDKATIGDLNSFSGGLGYNFGAFKLDFSYTNTQRDSKQSFFSQGFTDAAQIKTNNNNVTMTMTFEL